MYLSAEWAEAIATAAGATATFAAVLVSLFLVRSERQRAASGSALAVLDISTLLINLRGDLELNLPSVDPQDKLRLLTLRVAIAEVIIQRPNAPASYAAVFQLQKPLIDHVKIELAKWVREVDAQTPYDALPLRRYLMEELPKLVSLEDVKRFKNL
jgi:hypothetical protein